MGCSLVGEYLKMIHLDYHELRLNVNYKEWILKIDVF